LFWTFWWLVQLKCGQGFLYWCIGPIKVWTPLWVVVVNINVIIVMLIFQSFASSLSDTCLLRSCLLQSRVILFQSFPYFCLLSWCDCICPFCKHVTVRLPFQMYKTSTIILVVGYSFCFMDWSSPLPLWHTPKRFPTTFTYSSSARKRSAPATNPMISFFIILCPCTLFHKSWPLADNVDMIQGDSYCTLS